MRLFLSYSRKNEGAARRIYSDLRSSGIAVWFDREALLPGQDWQSAIKKAIEESDTVLLLLSSQSVDRRGYFQKEMRHALEVLQTIPHGHIYLLPVRIDECPIPEPLAAVHYVDLFPDYDAGIRKIGLALDFQERLKVEVRVRDSDTSANKSPQARILLVNDQPSTMNTLVDHLRFSGLSVVHAFSVPQAIRSISDNDPDVIISDLSHFSFGAQVTNRAAFEILEWGKRNRKDLKVIVTAAQITEERREEATRLGAIGIFNDASTLYRYINKAARVNISNPFPPEPEDVYRDAKIGHGPLDYNLEARQQTRPRSVFLWNMWHDKDDAEFTRRLASALRERGIDANFYEHTINFGATFHHPADDLIRRSDVVIFLLSDAAIKAPWLDEFIYKALLKKDALVIPALLDDKAARCVPPMLRRVVPIDFRENYSRGVEELVSFVQSVKRSP